MCLEMTAKICMISKFIQFLGDSLTAGNGALATNILQVFVENKGISWSIGKTTMRIYCIDQNQTINYLIDNSLILFAYSMMFQVDMPLGVSF